MTSDLHSAHRQALVETLFAEQHDDPDFRMRWWERWVWRVVQFYCRVRDAVRVLRGRAQIKVTYDR